MTRYPEVSQENAKHTEFRLRVGARDWRRSEWEGSYYPADLPPDWQLAYYANDFNGVLLPQSRWLSSVDEWEGWREDVPADFGFLLEYEGGSDDTARRCRETLGAAFGGWVGVAPGREPALASVDLGSAADDEAPVVRFGAADTRDFRRLGQRLVALSQRPHPVAALIASDGVSADALRRVRLAAELSGLA